MSAIEHPVLERIKVSNYRSLGEVDLTLGPLTVLVGPNGAGKSNVVDALRFVRDIFNHGLDRAVLDRGGVGALISQTAVPKSKLMGFEFILRGTTWGASYSFDLMREGKDVTLAFEWLEFEDKQDEPIKTYSYVVHEGEAVKTWRSPESFNNLLASLPISKKSLALPLMGGHPSISLVYDFLRTMGFYTIFPDALRAPQKLAHASPLDERGDNLASVLRQLKQDDARRVALTEALHQVVPAVRDFSVEPVGGYLVTRLHHAAAEGAREPKFELAQESDGTLRMLGILTALYQDPPRSLIAIEEPELTIHVGALGVLCDVLQEASLRGQVLITTHSPDLIARFPADSIRVVEMVDGTTKVGPISESQKAAIREHLFSPGDLMRMEGLVRADSNEE